MKFKPEDFDLQIKLSMTSDILNKKAAEMANAKLQEWLDAQPTVRGEEGRLGGDYTPSIAEWKRKFIWDGDETHKAKLVCIEEVTEEERFEIEEIK